MAKPIRDLPDGAGSEAALCVERHRAKKLAKIERRQKAAATSQSEPPPPEAAEDGDDDPETARKARKAEKKRQRKLKAAAPVPHGTNGSGQTPPQASSAEFSSAESVPKRKKESDTSNAARDGKDGEKHSTSQGQAYVESAALKAVAQSEIDAFLRARQMSIEDGQDWSPLRPIMSFSHLPSEAYASLKTSFQQFTSPTPIQSASWPFALAGRDVVGIAETGSGKTLAFGLPCLRHIVAHGPCNPQHSARAVIVSPTRELAVQIHSQIELLAAPAGIKTVCVYGGVPKDAQRTALQSASIVIATPGRLNDLVSEGSAHLAGVTYLVLDEADRMLDKGFEDAIRQIVAATASNTASAGGAAATAPAPRQTLMFTATWPPSVRTLASTFMRNPVRVTVGDSPTGELRANARIAQTVEVLDPRAKEQRLIQLLQQLQRGNQDRILVFALYKKEAARLEVLLRQKGFRVAGIHGDLAQERRTAALERFKGRAASVLVATDVAARGLDIPDVKAVINVTFPLTVEDYVHRIGRTGRAGATGLAITFFTQHDKALAGALVNVLRAAKQPVPDSLLKFGTAVKRKQHEAYGAFYRDTEGAGKAVKIRFSD